MEIARDQTIRTQEETFRRSRKIEQIYVPQIPQKMSRKKKLLLSNYRLKRTKFKFKKKTNLPKIMKQNKNVDFNKKKTVQIVEFQTFWQ